MPEEKCQQKPRVEEGQKKKKKEKHSIALESRACAPGWPFRRMSVLGLTYKLLTSPTLETLRSLAPWSLSSLLASGLLTSPLTQLRLLCLVSHLHPCLHFHHKQIPKQNLSSLESMIDVQTYSTAL
jgi:hypothetical protein